MNKRDCLTAEEKISHYTALVSLAISDRKVTDEELTVLEYAATKWGLSTEQAQEIIDDPKPLKSALPEDKDLRFELIYDIVELTIIDGVLTKKEKELCENAATQAGFKKEDVRTIIDGILEGNADYASDEEKHKAIKVKLGIA